MKILLLVLGLFFNAFLSGQEPPKPLFRSQEPLYLILETDFEKILKEVKTLDVRQSGHLKYKSATGDTHLIPVKTEPRGHYRRDPSNCTFPPLSVKFPQKNAGTPFEDITKLKIVTQCRRKARGQAYVVKEYLCYRFFNALTDTSFMVRPAFITYVDIHAKDTLDTHFTFFIERTRELRRRTGSEKIASEHFNLKWLDDYQATRLSLFQFMIGNTDWSAYQNHNTKAMESAGKRMAVPYDFDWSGFVNTAYATPHPDYPIKNVTQRHYIGKDADIEVFRRAAKEFKKAEQDVYALIENNKLLPEKEKKRSLRYIESFYDILSNERLWKSYFKIK